MTTNQLITTISLSTICFGCQRNSLPTQPPISDSTISKPIANLRTVLVKGAIIKCGGDTLKALPQISLVYECNLLGQGIETVTNYNACPASGVFQTRLRANYVYRVSLMAYQKTIYTIEIQTISADKGSVMTVDMPLGCE